MWGQIIGSAISGGLSYLGSRSANKSAEGIAEANMALQREFAQNGIRWKVEDAKQAGIHPLYALGASTPSFSPVSANFSNQLDGLASASQDIGRAIDSTRTSSERMESRIARLQVEGMEIDNAKKRAELRLLEQPASGPPGPSGSLGDSSLIFGDAFKVRPDIWAVPMRPPNVNDLGNPVFHGPAGVISEGARRTPHQDFEDYWGDIPSEVFSAGNVLRGY